MMRYKWLMHYGLILIVIIAYLFFLLGIVSHIWGDIST